MLRHKGWRGCAARRLKMLIQPARGSLGDDQGTVRKLSGGREIVPNPGRSTFAVYERDALEVRPAEPRGGARTPFDERAVRVPVLPPGESLGLAAISAGQRLLHR